MHRKIDVSSLALCAALLAGLGCSPREGAREEAAHRAEQAAQSERRQLDGFTERVEESLAQLRAANAEATEREVWATALRTSVSGALSEGYLSANNLERALHFLRSDAIRRQLIALLEDPHPDVRRPVVAAVCMLGLQEGRPRVEALQREDPSPHVREMARDGLARWGTRL